MALTGLKILVEPLKLLIMKFRQTLGTIAIAGIISISSIFVYSKFIQSDPIIIYPKYEQNDSQPPVQMTNFHPATAITTDFTESAEKTIHGVVHVMTKYSQSNSSYENPLFDFFFGDRSYENYQEPAIASGSGVIISKDGYIVTNNHVVKGATDIEITLNDKRTYTANLVGTDPSSDIALLKIDADDLPFLNYGNSDNLKVGEWVLAIGNPFNLTSTVTAGIVSAKARNINILPQNFAIESFIQTDAAVNPGNSGGALVNQDGELVGINTAIASRTGSYVGYSFAVPVNMVKKVINDLIEFGEVQRAFIGINIQEMDALKAKDLGMESVKGVYVAGTLEGGAAREAGITEGDVVTHIGQKDINSMSELQEQISKYRPGDKIDVSVIRNKKPVHFELILRNKHGNTDIVKTDESSLMGVSFSLPEPAELKKLRINNGVKINNIEDGKFKEAGIKTGFIIRSVNHRAVYNVDDVIKFINDTEGGVLIEGIYPNGMTAYYAFGK